MNSKTWIHATVLIFLFFTGMSSLHAQIPAEAVAEVPELTAFHKVIFKLWHEAWPNKDSAMFKDLLPDVEKGISQVASADLPGILREKKSAWKTGVTKLQSSGTEYRKAVESGDLNRMLDAAEILHSRFEDLIRLTRPILQELEDFHSSLYMLYHHYFPEYDLENIRSSAIELDRKMQILNAASLPEKLQSRDNDFQEARAKLTESVEAFRSSLVDGDEEAIKAAIYELHSDYQAVQRILD